jgi:uracil phosphoribosyltransferase
MLGQVFYTEPQRAPMLFASEHPLVRHKLALMRHLQTEPKQFRELVRELSMLLTYEATRDLDLVAEDVPTPMGTAVGQRLRTKIGLVPILRAGLGMVEGVLEMIPTAEVWHLGLYRDERTLHPVEYYNRLPTPNRVQLSIVLDPMLATGGTAVASVDILKRWGCERIKYIGLLGAPEGIERLSSAHPDVPIHLAAVDDRLNDVGYIVPGLGDAGDRQFGTA